MSLKLKISDKSVSMFVLAFEIVCIDYLVYSSHFRRNYFEKKYLFLDFVMETNAVKDSIHCIVNSVNSL